MRFIVMGMATKETETGKPPTAEDFAAMQKYHEELVKAGILLAAERLAPTSKGCAREVQRRHAHRRRRSGRRVEGSRREIAKVKFE